MAQANSVNSVPLLDVNRGNSPLIPEILADLEAILQSGRFIGGEHCQELEKTVAKYCDAEFAVGCASGSDALLVALMALGIEAGDEVIVPSFTFFATASCVWRLGAKPVFIDIEPDTFNLDVGLLRSLITDKTKAIIPVHLFGQCAEMNELNAIAEEYNLAVVEDMAQSIGASYEGKRAGSIGDVGCISFYPTKNLGGFGDGGMMTTNDPELAARLRLYANHGMSPRYYHKVVGVNSRLDSMQAAVLRRKIEHLDEMSANRRSNAERYNDLFGAAEVRNIVLPTDISGNDHVWNQYTIRVKGCDRDEVRAELGSRGVGSEIYYPVPLHQQECFSSLGYQMGDLPVTEQAAKEVLALPIFPELRADEIEYVVEQVIDLVESNSTIRRAA